VISGFDAGNKDVMDRYSRRVLVGDIGGTNIRFAITDIDELTISDFALLSSGDFQDPLEALGKYLKTVPNNPAMVSLAIAGPVNGDSAKMVNRPWTFDRKAVAAAAGAEVVHFVNDFEALALALPHLTSYELHQIGGGTVAEGAAKAVLGPGTGLGVAGLVHAHTGWVAIGGEGGHASFGATDRAELDLFAEITADLEERSAEDLISGRGLMGLYQVIARRGGQEPTAANPPAVVEEALVKNDPVAREALEQFAVWLGRFAGDIGLIYGARGGVYLGGGIAPNIVEVLQAGGFRKAFEQKERLASYLAKVPVFVIKTGADAGLRGAAVALAEKMRAKEAA
jgi:glucokinase